MAQRTGVIVLHMGGLTQYTALDVPLDVPEHCLKSIY